MDQTEDETTVTDQSRIDRYIELNPQRPGAANARLVGSGVPIWALVGYLEAAHGDLGVVAEDYGIARDAVEAAIAYYHQYRILIDARIAANAA
ncbi:MAG TPA: hypothetical protein VNL16_04875 [Chloroflexota bacterium]|nr:hypothetical protein [Chloroflexota bacterium]